MTSGAVEFLNKPFREQELLDAVRRTIDSDRVARLRRAKLADCADDMNRSRRASMK